MEGKHRLSTFFNIEPGEGRLVLLMLGLYACIGIAFNFTQTAAFSLFLAQYSSRTLSYVYIISAVLITLLTTGYIRLGQRVTFQKMLLATLFFLLAAILISWVGMALSGASWVVFLLPVLFQVLINFGNLVFWPLANRLFTVRQSKRLFSLIGSGQWISIVLTGFIMGAAAARLGTGNLLILAGVGMGAAIVMLVYITRSYAPQLSAQAEKPGSTEHKEARKDEKSAGKLFRSRYVLLIFALTVAWWIGFFLLDNLFYDRSAARYPDPSQLAGFLGFYLSGLGILTLASNFLVAGRVITHFGLRTSLRLLPGLLVVVMLILGLTGTLGGSISLLFWLTIVAKLSDMVVGFSIDRPIHSILYQPLPVIQRGQAQALSEGIFQPLANGLAGVILLVLAALFSSGTLPLIYTTLLIALVWLGVAILLGREYPGMLVKALDKRRLEGKNFNLADGSSLSILKESLKNRHPGPVIYAASLLEEIDPESLGQAIPSLLEHPAQEVRQDAFERIERMSLISALPAARMQLRVETMPGVRQSALRSILSFGESEDFARVPYHLDNPIPQVRLGAITGLLRSGGIEGVLMAGQKLLELVNSRQPADRVLAAKVLGEVGLQNYYQPLVRLLDDEDSSVRRAALRAAGKIGSPKLMPKMLVGLASPAVRGAAVSALVMGGASNLPSLSAAFSQPGQSRAVLRALVQAAGRISGPQALEFLTANRNYPDLEVRTQILNALGRCGYLASGVEAAQVNLAVHEEAGHSAWLLACLCNLGDSEDVSILRSALLTQLQRSRERILLYLSFTSSRKTLVQAQENLTHPAAEKRSYALEVIDTLLNQILKGLVIPLLDDSSPGQRLEKLSAAFPQHAHDLGSTLADIAGHPLTSNDPWSAACALYTMGHLRYSSFSETVQNALKSDEPLICNAAAWALQAFLQGEINMLSIIERVLILKKVSIFAETPDDILAEVAQALDEVDYAVGDTVFQKGEPGSSMFMIAEGKVRVFDGGRTLNYLGEGDVFGEMALLDPEPRVASVAVTEDARLLSMDQEALYELMDSRVEVARGIIHVLSRHLRNRLQDLNRLQNIMENPARA